MTTEIISLVLLVLVSFVVCFVMKIYSILRAPECSFDPVHDIEIDATNTDRGAHLSGRAGEHCWNISLFLEQQRIGSLPFLLNYVQIR